MTVTAYYMKFRPRTDDDEDFIGGRPTVCPSAYPWPEEDDEVIAFLAQFRVDGARLKIPDAEWLQLYQGVEEGDDPTPIAVVISKGAGQDDPVGRRLPVHPEAPKQGISFEEEEDPDHLPEGIAYESQGRYFLSKLGGLDPWSQQFEEGRFLGQLHEAAPRLNLGGRACGLYLRSDNTVVAVLR